MEGGEARSSTNSRRGRYVRNENRLDVLFVSESRGFPKPAPTEPAHIYIYIFVLGHRCSCFEGNAYYRSFRMTPLTIDKSIFAKYYRRFEIRNIALRRLKRKRAGRSLIKNTTTFCSVFVDGVTKSPVKLLPLF